jgi:hypothetical protein
MARHLVALISAAGMASGMHRSDGCIVIGSNGLNVRQELVSKIMATAGMRNRIFIRLNGCDAWLAGFLKKLQQTL